MKILLIGNKTDIPDKTDAIKELAPDIVVRVNKCNSWEKTKTAKTDLWLMDIYSQTIVNAYMGMPKECLASMGQSIFFYENAKNVSLGNILRFTSLNKLHIVSFNKTIPIKKYLPRYNFYVARPSNFMWMVIYCLENLDGDVYVTACDIEDRSYLSDNICHSHMYKDEQKAISQLVKEGKIHVI